MLWQDLRYLPPIFHYIATSMNQETIVKVLSTKQANSNSLQILSNDIRHSAGVENENGPEFEATDHHEDEPQPPQALLLAVEEDDIILDDWDDSGDVNFTVNIKEFVQFLSVLNQEFGTNNNSKWKTTKEKVLQHETCAMLGTGKKTLSLFFKKKNRIIIID
jgi:hypothetical protein